MNEPEIVGIQGGYHGTADGQRLHGFTVYYKGSPCAVKALRRKCKELDIYNETSRAKKGARKMRIAAHDISVLTAELGGIVVALVIQSYREFLGHPKGAQNDKSR